MELTNYELININGGNTVSAALINAVARGISVLYSLGKALGSAIRYIISKTYC